MSFKNLNCTKKAAFVTTLALCVALSGCGDSSPTDNNKPTGVEQIQSENTLSEVIVDTLDTSSMFSERDAENSFDESKAEVVKLNKNSVDSSADGVSLKDSVLTFSKEGVFVLKGSFEGQIAVNAPDTAKVQLVLDGVQISCENSAAIYAKNADKLFVTAKENTTNTLSTSGAFKADGDTNVDGVIFSKCDLTLNGTGTIEITSEAENAVVSKDELVICGSKLSIDCKNHGLDANDSIKIKNGEFDIISGKDAIHAENAEDTSKGFVYIENGKFTLGSAGDAISSSMIVQIENGEFDITTNGVSGTSSKGIKAETSLILNDGSFNITSTDDALHSASNVVVKNAKISISSGDDAIHSDNNVSINGGEITVTKSYEGIEAQTINITGGTTSLVASDDGINAAGGNDQSGFGGRDQDTFNESATGYINISGGKLSVDAGGDGIDANGKIVVSGGETYISGPTNSGNGALDYGAGAEITGGIFVATGASGMSLGFSGGTQGAILTNVTNGSDKLLLKDSDGNELVSFSPSKSYSSVVVSCPEIKEGNTYTLTANGSDLTIEMTSLIYGSGGFGGGFGGGNMGGGKGNRKDFNKNGDMPIPDGEMPEMPNGELPQMPNGDFPQGQMIRPDGERPTANNDI